MNKHLLTAALLAAATTFGVSAEETTVFELTSTTFGECTQNCYEYDRSSNKAWSWSNYYGAQMYHYSYSYNKYSDYLTTPALELKTGELYVLYTTPKAYSSTSPANLEILLGQGDDEREYTQLKLFESLSSGYSAPAQQVSFSVPEDGEYHLSFHGYPGGIYVDKTKLTSLGVVYTPMAAEDFKAQPDAEGALSVALSFTMPTKTISNADITGDVEYALFRGSDVISEGSAAAGSKVEFTDAPEAEGSVAYKLQLIYNGEAAEPQELSTFVGVETPTAPTEASLTLTPDGFLVSWNAPEKGVNGASLAADKLSYDVVRYVDGEPSTVAEGISTTEFTDEYSSDELHVLKYGISARYGVKTSDVAETQAVKVGTASLPFADSFAGAELSPLWDNEIVSGQYAWQAVASDSRNGEPVDSDGGMLYFQSFSYSAANQARLVTPPFAYVAGQSPVVSFYMWHRASAATEGVKVQISLDYGDWQDVEGGYVLVTDGTQGWGKHTVALKDALESGCTSYRVAFSTKNEYKFNIDLDAIEIFNLMEKDAAISAVGVPETVKAGTTATLTVEVSNKGSQDLAADGYTLSVDSNYPGEIELPELEAIASLESKLYTIELPVNSFHMQEGTEFTFVFSVEAAGDEDPSNNSCEEQLMVASYSSFNAASGLDGFMDDDKNITLTWESAKDMSYVPVNEEQSFEDFEDGANGPFGGWVSLDLDKAAGTSSYGTSGSEFMVTNMSTPTKKDGSKAIGLTCKGGVEQNDWLISPAVSCKDGSSMKLEFLLGFGSVYSTSSYSYYNYNVSIYYATEDYDPENPAAAFVNQVDKTMTIGSYSSVKLDGSLYAVSYEGIPSEAKYVAIRIHGKSNSTSYNRVVWMDKMHLYEVDESPLLGYHVYSMLNGRLNEEMLSPETTSFTIPKTEEGQEAAPMFFMSGHPVFVSAVYPDGEAEPSNFVDLNALVDTGIDNVIVDGASSNGEATYYDLSGKRLHKTPTLPGIYIRRAGDKAEKVRL
ncbi:MAG: hypothetical protein K2M06_09195 [Muribaculaceae bacterium]|nr:hypothetical protein [Muribaculaceae bacterium]